MSIPITVYLCPVCEEPHRNAGDARFCCTPETSEAWECATRFPLCDVGFHLSEKEAKACASGLIGVCVCGHRGKSHGLASSWAGCYDLDCRCPKFEQAQAVAA